MAAGNKWGTVRKIVNPLAIPLVAVLACGTTLPAYSANSNQQQQQQQAKPAPAKAAPNIRTAPAPQGRQQLLGGNGQPQLQRPGAPQVRGGTATARTLPSPPHLPGNMATGRTSGNSAAAHIPSGLAQTHGPVSVPEAHVPNAASGAHLPSSLAAGKEDENDSKPKGRASAVAAHIPKIGKSTAHVDAGHRGNVASVHGNVFHTRDVKQFNPRELAIWQGGDWHHAEHDGQSAWWWKVNDDWYPYPDPVYPYPLVVATVDGDSASLDQTDDQQDQSQQDQAPQQDQNQ